MVNPPPGGFSLPVVAIVAFGALVAVFGASAALFASVAGGCLFPPAQAAYYQPGLYDAFPAAGRVGGYDVSWPEPEGYRFTDPHGGEWILGSVSLRVPVERPRILPHMEYRLEPDDRVGVWYTMNHSRDIVRAGFLAFVSNITTADAATLEAWADEIDARREPMDQPLRSRPGADLEIHGPYRFEALYDSLREATDGGAGPNHWEAQGGDAVFGRWTFEFPTWTKTAEESGGSGVRLTVDARDRAHIALDGARLTSAGFQSSVAATHLELGLPPSPPHLGNQANGCWGGSPY